MIGTLLVSPLAGNGAAARLTAGTAARLAEAFDRLDTVVADSAAGSVELSRHAIRNKTDVLITLGGDGLAHAAIQACAGTDTAFAVIPAGTGNDLARTLDMPRSPLAAVDALVAELAAGRSRRIDLGWISATEADRPLISGPTPDAARAGDTGRGGDAPGGDAPAANSGRGAGVPSAGVHRVGVHRAGADSAGADRRGDRSGRSAVGGYAGAWFGTVLCAGFDSRVNAFANRLRWPTGQWRYNAAIAAELVRLRPGPLEVRTPERTVRLDATMISIGNGRYYGGGVPICPDAELDDGRFDVTVVGALSRTDLARVLPHLRTGRHVDHPAVTALRAVSVTLSGPDWTGYADGERQTRLPLTATCVPGALRVIAPVSA